MSDHRLRNLLRRFHETQDPRDGTTYVRVLERCAVPEEELLRARLEVGELTRDRLRVAAYAGHSVSRRLLGVEGPVGPLGDPVPWLMGLPVLGRQASVMGAVSLSRLWLEERDDRPRSEQRELERTIQVAEAWLSCPCPLHLELVGQAGWPASWIAEWSFQQDEWYWPIVYEGAPDREATTRVACDLVFWSLSGGIPSRYPKAKGWREAAALRRSWQQA